MDGFDKKKKTATHVLLFLKTWKAFKQVVPSQWKIVKARTILDNIHYDCDPIVVENAKRLTFGIPLTLNETHTHTVN